ncbi:MAG: hypothetical protein HKO59_17925 [Phycisphaerales bacterium]|nr:hypothetical protein [Phycisphaerales bacterium]NNM27819.1 hypothetical protein [Phycisphaerales bacterium]
MPDSHPRPVPRQRWAPLAMLLLVLVAIGSAWAYPTPAAVPFRWELDFRPGELRLYVDPVDGAAYWYFNYAVVNRTGSDQIWAPSMVIFTDTGEILSSGEGVPSRVEETLRDLLGNPLLETQNEIIGDLHQGQEHARDGVVVWPARDTQVNELAMFVGGLSGETARVRNPLTGDEVILRKTLRRDYLIRGNALARGSRPVELVDQSWVLR